MLLPIKLRSLKTVRTHQGRAIYNGFSAQIPELNLLLCDFHLEKGDIKKLLQLNPQKGAVKRILAYTTDVTMGQLRSTALQIQRTTKIWQYDWNH